MMRQNDSVLILEDSLTVGADLEDLFTAAGFRVVLCPSLKEARTHWIQGKFDLLVLDIHLPDGDGLSFLGELQNDPSFVPIPVIILGLPEDLHERTCNLGKYEQNLPIVYVGKPYERGKVLQQAQALCQGNLHGPWRILAADDSPTYLASIAEPLRKDGYDVVSAVSGEEALSLLDTQAVDCVLLDLTMPGISGQETCHRIKAKQKNNVPVIMLTGREDEEAMLESFNAGADDYVPKSSEFVVLKARVQAQLRRSQSEAENLRIREDLAKKEIEAVESRASQELAEQRGKLLAKLEKANQDLEAFGYSVSHDLKAPLRRIEGFSKVILEDFGPQIPDEAKGLLSRISAGCKSMNTLIESMIKLAQLDRAELKRVPIDLSSEMRQIAERLQEQEAYRSTQFNVEPLMSMQGDLGFIQIVLENLIGNAFKYSAKSPQPHVFMGSEQIREQKVFFVKDNGIGFDMKFGPKIFTPFLRLHSKEYEGTGIGLFTVRRIIERHEGKIWVESQPQVGTIFRFTFDHSQ